MKFAYNTILFALTLILVSVESKYLFGKLHGRIVGGEPTTIEEVPYQVSVIFIDQHYCGGSIIHKKYVLTAAHCTNTLSAEDFLIRAGSTYLESGGQVKRVIRIFEHNQFDPNTYDYDVSIFELDSELTLSSSVAIVNLPSQNYDVGGLVEGIASGWGRLSTDGPIPFELQKVILPTLFSNDCQKVYDTRVTDRMICAGYEDGQKDTCQGDSGGPYVINGLLIGITSWGDGCGEANSPGVYTKVSYFVDFINGVVKNKRRKL